MIRVFENPFLPDFEASCSKCGTSPCVLLKELTIEDNLSFVMEEKETGLCGPCYFEDPQMLDYWLWNEYDDTYLKTEPETDDD